MAEQGKIRTENIPPAKTTPSKSTLPSKTPQNPKTPTSNSKTPTSKTPQTPNTPQAKKITQQEKKEKEIRDAAEILAKHLVVDGWANYKPRYDPEELELSYRREPNLTYLKKARKDPIDILNQEIAKRLKELKAPQEGDFRIVAEKPQWVYGLKLDYENSNEYCLVKVGKTEVDPERNENNRLTVLTKKTKEHNVQVLFTLRVGSFYDIQLLDHEKWIRSLIGWEVEKGTAKKLQLPVPTEWVICHKKTLVQLEDRIVNLKREITGEMEKYDTRCFSNMKVDKGVYPKQVTTPWGTLRAETFETKIMREGKIIPIIDAKFVLDTELSELGGGIKKMSIANERDK